MIAKIPTPGEFDLTATPRAAPRVPDHELLRCIGRGSYGEVWLARSVVGTLRAIKLVYRSTFEDNRPFEREFSGIQKFEPISRSNDGLVHVLQIGRNVAEGYFYYVMELSDDASVSSVKSALPEGRASEHPGPAQPIAALGHAETYLPRTLAVEKMGRGNLGAEECVRIGAALAQALDHLHQNGLIHRDIKPSNIVFVKGAPKLADIGLVAGVGDAHSYVGTEGFIPPEGPNSPQADIYSLGKVLYEVAMGKDRQDFPEPCSELGERADRKLLIELNAIILKACERDPKRRYKTSRQMHDELMLLQRGKSVREKHAGERRVRVLTWIGVAVAALTLAVLCFDRWLDWRVRSIQGSSSLTNPALIGKIRPRESSAPRDTIDLSPFYTAPMDEAWYPGPQENTLAAMPKGIQTFAGTKFDARGLVQLSGREIAAYDGLAYPRQTLGIPLGRWVRRLYFLEGAVSEAVDGARIGAYHVQYRNGRTLDIPIVYGRDLRALWQPDDSSGIVSNSLVAWTGENPAARERRLALRVYKQTWENPSPGDEIISLAFDSAMANSAPFLLGLTCDDYQPSSSDQRELGVNLLKALQTKAMSFKRLPMTNQAGPCRFAQLKLNEHPLQLGGMRFDGFRFNTPPGKAMDLVWVLESPANLHLIEWFICPVQGGMKVGFEDFYHGVSQTSKGGAGEADLALQFLSAKKLQPGRAYFIWLAFDRPESVEFHAAMRFARPGEIDANNPETLVRAMGLEGLVGTEGILFHRHYCLGAIR